MKRKAFLVVGVLGISLGSIAVADPVDNPGDARFYDSTGVYNNFFTFASSEALSASTEQFDAYATSSGDIFFDSASTPFHSTAQTIGSSGTPIEAQLFITDVSGVVDLSSGVYADWQITAQVRFRAFGAGVTPSNCQTASFTIDIAGDYAAGVHSAPFTIPSLSGTGTGACNGNSTEINLDFALGSSGADLYLTKWWAQNIATGDDLTGS